MKPAIFLLLICLTGYISVFSQTFGSHQVALTPTAFPKSDFDKEAYGKKLHQKFAGQGKQSDLESYIENNSIQMEAFFASSQIYANWPQATAYVKKVFTSAIPKEFNTSDIKIYVVRDPEPNAFCMEDGNIAVTVGFLSYMNSEAELAAVLGHEFGHYYSNHLYAEFKKQSKNKILKSLVYSNSLIGTVMLIKNMSHYQQDQERQADTFACNFFTRNGYRPEAIAETFESFQQITNRYKKLSGYRRPLIYFSSHPSDEERISNARNAFKNRPLSGRNFLQDSATFFAVKKQAIDETIYLLFEQLQYPECLEMAYRQYLYQPNDEFYLFFITECLRRQMVVDPFFKQQLFITGNYKNLTLVSEPSAQTYNLYVKGKEPEKISPKQFSKSIYANLQSEVYYLSDAEVKAIAAPEMKDKSQLQYLYNEDAFYYFSSKIPASSCVFNLRHMLLAEPLASCTNAKSGSDLEEEYKRNASDFGVFRQNSPTYKKAALVLYNIKLDNGYDPVVLNDLYEQYHKIAGEYPDEVIDAKNKFNFRELQKITNTTLFIESLGIKGFFKKNEKDCDFLAVFPELSSEINKFGYRKLIFLEITVVNPAPKGTTGGFMAMGESWTTSIYTIDLVDKKAHNRQDMLNYLSAGTKREQKFNNVLGLCQGEAKK
jgi:hypothetical protein